MKTLTILMLLISTSLFANNIVVENCTLTGQNTTDEFRLVQFDLSWDNAWRANSGPNNWDAAWVFVKYRKLTGTIWQHATLHYVDGSGSGDGHTEPGGSDINSADDTGAGGAHGVFIHPDAVMAQASVDYNGVELRWDYGVDRLGDGDSVEVSVVAIEMVLVPTGSFDVGSGGTEGDAFFTYPTSTDPYTISSENAITVGTTTGLLYYTASGFSGDQLGPIPSSFPKGFAAFYCMKYEISQDQYVDFLNKLTSTQDANRYPNANGFHRHAITGSAGSHTTTNPYVACNYLSWADGAAYLDWAALRPMTEFEYEKSCRGTEATVPNEYAWGAADIAEIAYTLSFGGLVNEAIATNYSTVAGNASYNITKGTINGPLRCGIFAAHGMSTGRESAGAGYYGIMELSGNLLERAVTVGNPSGRAYTGMHGDGLLSSAGDANIPMWPGTSALGAGFRGGSWVGFALNLRISDRNSAAITYSDRYDYNGLRGVRRSP